MYPLIIENIHSIQHSSDKHCSSSNHHIHQQEHHCAVCDFAPPVFDESVVNYHAVKSNDHFVSHSFFYQTIALFTFLKGTSLRAPPIQ